MTPTEALDEIWRIVHVPTSKTSYRTASDHFQADFDRIRKIIEDAKRPSGVDRQE
jgi:hypothetical protein